MTWGSIRSSAAYVYMSSGQSKRPRLERSSEPVVGPMVIGSGDDLSGLRTSGRRLSHSSGRPRTDRIRFVGCGADHGRNIIFGGPIFVGGRVG